MDKKIAMSHFNKRITQKAIAVSLGLFLILNVGYSQDFKLAGIHYGYYPKSEVKDASGNQEVSFQEFSAFLNFPKQLKNNKTVLINGVGYGLVEATLHNPPSLLTSKDGKKLHAFYYQLTLAHKWNEKWTLLANIKPTFASDFEEKLGSDDLIFQGLVMATRKMNDKFKIGAGVLNSTRLGEPIVLPVVNMHYKSNRSELNALLPMNIKYTYSLLPEEKLKLGVKYARNGANFNILANDMADIDKINYSRANVDDHRVAFYCLVLYQRSVHCLPACHGHYLYWFSCFLIGFYWCIYGQKFL
jgi:hypothetical protein